MTLPAPTYDLILMLDTQASAPTRAKIVADARAAIEAQGELVRQDEWGTRALAYQIDHKADAEYHLLQFHASTPELLASLERSLRIADEIVRFRIVKLKPGTPEAPDMKSGAIPSRHEPTAEAESVVEAVVEVAAEVEVEAVLEAGEPAQAG
ncbi:MAG: 30S ribosomal protein S6 [Solirubrobacterales bacterium]